MGTPKVFILIVILVMIGAAVLAINYTKLPVEAPRENELSTGQEKNSISEEVKIAEIEKIKDEIKTEAEGEIVKYQEESFYSEGDFSAILENQTEFKTQLIVGLKKNLIGVSAENFEFYLDQSKKSAILKCNIKGARYGTNSYDMHFLLNGTKRFGFDLYGFKEVGKKFIYEGKINGIPTKIVFEFPYEFGHCHEHIWPE